MRYALLIYSDEKLGETATPDEMGAIMEAYGAFTKDLTESGKYIGGEALHPTNTAKTVSVRDGKTQVVDGPFAETKEQFGGYYLVEADSIEEAAEWAAKIPGASIGRVEVRLVWEFDM